MIINSKKIGSIRTSMVTKKKKKKSGKLDRFVFLVWLKEKKYDHKMTMKRRMVRKQGYFPAFFWCFLATFNPFFFFNVPPLTKNRLFQFFSISFAPSHLLCISIMVSITSTLTCYYIAFSNKVLIHLFFLSH